MLTFNEHPQTIDQVQVLLETKFSETLKKKKPLVSIDRPTTPLNSLRLVSHGMEDFCFEVGQTVLLIQAKNWKLNLNLERFVLTTEYSKDRFIVCIQTHPDADHRHFSSALRQISGTKHPTFYSRILRAFHPLEDDLPASTIDQVSAAPTDFMVAL